MKVTAYTAAWGRPVVTPVPPVVLIQMTPDEARAAIEEIELMGVAQYSRTELLYQILQQLRAITAHV